MSEGNRTTPERSERGVAEALRAAVERTLEATAGSASETRERAVELLDEVTRRGRDAGDELARRGQQAGARIEELLRRQGGTDSGEAKSKPKVED